MSFANAPVAVKFSGDKSTISLLGRRRSWSHNLDASFDVIIAPSRSESRYNDKRTGVLKKSQNSKTKKWLINIPAARVEETTIEEDGMS